MQFSLEKVEVDMKRLLTVGCGLLLLCTVAVVPARAAGPGDGPKVGASVELPRYLKVPSFVGARCQGRKAAGVIIGYPCCPLCDCVQSWTYDGSNCSLPTCIYPDCAMCYTVGVTYPTVENVAIPDKWVGDDGKLHVPAGAGGPRVPADGSDIVWKVYEGNGQHRVLEHYEGRTLRRYLDNGALVDLARPLR